MTIYLYEDAAGTTPVTADGDPIGKAEDRSTQNKDMTQSVTANRPIYKTDGTTQWAEFNLTNQNIGIDFTGTGGFTATLIQASKEGTFKATVTIPDGTWEVTQNAAYFPSDNIIGVFLVEGDISTTTEAKVFTYFESIGSAGDFAGVTSMENWFRDRDDIVELDASNWDTSSVTTMRGLVGYSDNLEALNCSNWDTSSVQDFAIFAENCDVLVTLDVSNWDTSSATIMNNFISNCPEILTLDVSNWDTSSVVNFNQFAFNARKLTALDVSNWDTSSVIFFSRFAASCFDLTALDVSNWDTSSAVNFSVFISGSNSLTTLDVSNWDTSLVTTFAQFAQNCTSLTTVTVNGGTGSPFSDSACTNYTNAFVNTNLSQQSIDDILVAIEAAGTASGTFDQSGGSAPSATGEAAIDALRGRSWTVTVTGGY